MEPTLIHELKSMLYSGFLVVFLILFLLHLQGFWSRLMATSLSLLLATAVSQTSFEHVRWP